MYYNLHRLSRLIKDQVAYPLLAFMRSGKKRRFLLSCYREYITFCSQMTGVILSLMIMFLLLVDLLLAR